MWNQPILLGTQCWQCVPNIVAGEFLNKVLRGFGLISDLFVQIWLEQQVEVTLRFPKIWIFSLIPVSPCLSRISGIKGRNISWYFAHSGEPTEDIPLTAAPLLLAAVTVSFLATSAALHAAVD